MRFLLQTVYLSPVRWWLLAFVLVSMVSPQDGHTNVNSRLALMSAMADDQTFHIDQRWTEDWARTPDGHYYSNKAPGPALFGLPVLLLIDQVVFAFEDPEKPAGLVRNHHRVLYSSVLSMVLQVLPFALLTAFAIGEFRKIGISPMALHYAALALLFGNTASLLMNSYFGHAMAAVFLLSMVLALMRRRFYVSGLMYGCALLSDYGIATVLLPLLICIAVQERRPQPFGVLLLGGIVPGALWMWYHIAAFGHPFTLALKYQAPMYIESGATTDALWGMLSIIPDGSALIALLFGTTRGLLFTQPWVLLVFCIGLVALLQSSLSTARTVFGIAIPSLVLLLWMNGSFNGWHGGLAPGPRYISPVLPLFGLGAGLLYGGVSLWVRALLWALLSVSVLFALFVLSGQIALPYHVPLWIAVLEPLTNTDDVVPLIRLLLMLSILIAALVASIRFPSRSPGSDRS